MSEEAKSEKPEIYVDDDWKQRVKAEDAALDEQRSQEKPSAAPQEEAKPDEATAGDSAKESRAPEIDASQIPPAGFSTLVGMFSTQAMVSLGLIANPATGQPEPQLPLAKHFIDLLGVVEEKTSGNLTPNEHELLETTLHQLRMAYIELSKQAKSAEPAQE